MAEWMFILIYNDELDSFRLRFITYIVSSSCSLVHNISTIAYCSYTLTVMGIPVKPSAGLVLIAARSQGEEARVNSYGSQP